MVEIARTPNPYNLTCHNNDYTQQVRLGSYIGMELNQEMGFTVGTGSLTIPWDHPLAGRIMQASRDVVPITASADGWAWTGRVDSYEASGEPGREVITAQLVDDKKQLADVLAFASPRSVLAVQRKRDHEIGRLEEAAHHYFSENLARAELDCYLMLPPIPSRDKSPRVDLAARMTRMDELLRDVFEEHDYEVSVRMWWPGEQFPDGKFAAMVGGDATARRYAVKEAELDQVFRPDAAPVRKPTKPGLIVDVRPVRDRPHVRFASNGADVVSFKLSGKSPGGVRQIVGGKSDDWVNETIGMGIDAAVQGIVAAIGSFFGPVGAVVGFLTGGVIGSAIKSETEDTLFAFTDRTDVQRRAEMGPFHPREGFTSSSAGVFTFDTNALAERALVDAMGGQAIEITIADGVSKVLGVDQRAENGKIRHGYLVGDRVTFLEHLSGVVVSDIITGVTVSDSVEERARVTPRVGKRKNMSNPYLDFVSKLNKSMSVLTDLGLRAG